MAAPVTTADEADVAGQANPNGPTQASVYNGPSAVAGVSARTLATLLSGETPIIGARRVDHADMVDYGFGADGIEYLLTTSGGVLIPDVAGLTRILVLANDVPGGTADDDRINSTSLTVSTAAAHGLAIAYQGAIWYAPFVGYDGDDALEYTVDSDGADTSAATAVTLTVLEAFAATPRAINFSVSRGITVTLNPASAFDNGNEEQLAIQVQAVEITAPPAKGTATVVGRQVTYAAPADYAGEARFSWRMLLNGIWSTAAEVRIAVGQIRRRSTARGWPRRISPPPDAGTPSSQIGARNDSSVAAANTAVTIAVLANDVGANLSILSVGTPSSGAAVANLDGTITYTPANGFSGTATFTYTITDGVSSSTATVTVEVDPEVATVFANDYEAKGELWVAPDSESMTGFELLVDYTDPLLRTQANGGVVRSSSGHDIRCEDGAGNALDYCRISYSPTTGRWVGIVKFDRTTGSVWSNLEVYAGKQGSVTDQADAAGALSGLLACWRMDTGADLTGNGRNLTVTGATASLLYGCPAAQFDLVDDKAELADPSGWLDGIAAFTLSMDLQHDQLTVDSGFFRIGGTVTGIDADAHMGSRADSASFFANPAIANLYSSLLTVTVSGSPQECRIEGSANGVRTGIPTTYALAWGSGGAWTIVADEVVQSPAYISPATQTGTLAVPGGPLAFGSGPRGPYGGIIGLTRVASSRRSNAWLQAEQRNRRRPSQLIARSVMITPGDSAAPVAFPDTAAATGVDLTISPLANDTGSGLSINSAFATSGTVEITSATTLLYRQAPAFAGTALISYTIQDSAGRLSSSIITVTVSGTPLSAANDTATTVATTPVIIPVLANDSGVGLAVVAVSDPPHGIAGISGGGTTVTYTADAAFQGVDSFTYTVEDDDGQQRAATVAVTVSPPTITALDDARTVVQNVPIDISVLSNDTGTGLFISGVTTPTNGTATRVSGNTQIQYRSTASFTGTATFSYTIQDSYGQSRTATVTMTVTSGASPVDAINNAYSATQGVAIDLPVLANDLPATGLTISAVGTPSNGGTATRILSNTQIRYTSAASFLGTETFTYTATDGTNFDTATVSMTVSAADTSIPKYPPTPTSNAKIRTVGYTAPTGGTTYAAGDAGLTAAINAALPGDEIGLADGTYTADRTISRDGSAAGGHIVIKARNHRQAITTGYWRVDGDYVWITGLTMAKGGPSTFISTYADSSADLYSVDLRGKNQRVTNCRVDSPNGIRIHCSTTSSSNFRTENIDICCNDFTGRTAPRRGGCNGIYMGNMQSTSRGCNNVLIARNKVHQNLAITTGPDSDDDWRCWVYTGNEKPGDNNVGNNTTVRFVENYIDMPLYSKLIYMKRGNLAIRNYIKRVRAIAFTLRHGGLSRADGSPFPGFTITNANRCIWQGNNVADGKTFINDTDHLLVSNLFQQVELFCGQDNPPYQAASKTILVGNTIQGALKLGTNTATAYTPEGGDITGVKNYTNGIAQPSGSDLVRENVVAGNAGYQELSGNGGFGSFVTSYITEAEILALNPPPGCDPE